MFTTVLAAISTLLLSYLFVIAGVQKISQTAYLQQVITDYKVIPASWSPWLARGLPLIELGAGLALLIPASRWHLAQSRACSQGIAQPWPSTSSGAEEISIVAAQGPGRSNPSVGGCLGRNLLLITIALLSGLTSRQLQLDWRGWCLALLGAALAALLYHVFNQLIANNDLLRRIARYG